MGVFFALGGSLYSSTELLEIWIQTEPIFCAGECESWKDLAESRSAVAKPLEQISVLFLQLFEVHKPQTQILQKTFYYADLVLQNIP